MNYPGGKNQAGTYQQIINLIPPHSTYIETHLGSGAIVRAKRPAGRNILIDLDPGVIAAFGDAYRYPPPETTMGAPIVANGDVGRIARSNDTGSHYELINADALAWLRAYPFRGDEFIYSDPPYLLGTRRQPRRIYRCELSEADHVALLACLLSLPCKVMISGYWSELYAGMLTGWHTVNFQAITRGGSMATEWLWMNYPRPVRLHEYTYLGDGFRERERIKRKAARWAARLRGMSPLERQAILAALEDLEESPRGMASAGHSAGRAL